MKRFLKNVAFITIPTLIVLFVLLELVFRFVIVAPDPPRQCMDREQNIMRFDTAGARHGVYTAGRFGQQKARWRVNNAGWLSPVDYHPKAVRTKPLVAVIGDSYVEALQVDSDKSFVALLGRALADSFDVYSFGLSDTPLSGYLHLARYVNRVYEPDVLIFTIVHNDFDESVREIHFKPNFLQVSLRDGAVVEIPPVPRTYNWLKRFAFHSAAVRYVYYLAPGFFHRLNWNTERPREYRENIDVARADANRETIRRCTAYLIDTICGENRRKRVYFIMAAPRSAVYADSLASAKRLWMNDMMAELTAGRPCVLVDQTGYFANDYRENGTRFESPYDPHWNEYGHEATFRQLLGVLRDRSTGLWN